MRKIVPALLALFGMALFACAADNELQVKATGMAAQRTFELKKTVTELDDRIIDEALSEYSKFVEDWEPLDETWQPIDAAQGQLTIEGIATLKLGEINQWLEARGVNRQGAIQVVVMEEPPSIGQMKIDEAFGTGIDGSKFFLQNYTLFQRQLRDAIVKKVGTLGFDVQLLEDKEAYKRFRSADGTLVGVHFDPDANQFAIDRDLLDAVRAQQPDTVVLHYRVDTLAFEPKTREMRSTIALNFKSLANGVTKSIGEASYSMVTTQTQKDLILDEFAFCTVRAANKLMNDDGAAERLNHLAMSNGQPDDRHHFGKKHRRTRRPLLWPPR